MECHDCLVSLKIPLATGVIFIYGYGIIKFMEDATVENQNKIIDMKVSSLQKIKKFFLIATITLFSISAVLGIFFILFGADSIGGNVISTTAILGLLSLLTTNNIARSESKNIAVKVTSIGAIISNVVWVIPWICLVWDVFRPMMCAKSYYIYGGGEFYNCSGQMNYYDTIECLWKIVGVSLVFSIVLTITSGFLKFKKYNSAIQILKIITIICACFLGLYFMFGILGENWAWLWRYEGWRLIAVVAVVLVFGLIVTPILVKVQAGKEKLKKDFKEQSKESEAELRARLEKEIRAEIAAEQEKNQSNEENS